MDDEVRGHPSLCWPKATSRSHPEARSYSEHSTSPEHRPTPSLSSCALELQTQLQTQPTTVINPLTRRTITRFGASYWKLLITLFGAQSALMASEKAAYRERFPRATRPGKQRD